MKQSLLTLLAFLAESAVARGQLGPRATDQPETQPFEYAVLFGDSYTDDGLGNYFFNNGLQLPPPGQRAPETTDQATGGKTWGEEIEEQLNATTYDFAFGGSTCSNKIVARSNPFYGGVAVPSVLDEMVPYLKTQVNSTLFANATKQNTVYSIWIGTNDLGVNAFLTDNQVPGKTPQDYVDCIWNSFDGIYAAGGRRFILLTNNALDLAPLYQLPSKGGVTTSTYWPNKTDYNQEDIHDKMKNLVDTTNDAMIQQGPVQAKNRWPDADFTIFDVHQLMTDIYYNPTAYLDPPANSTWYYNDCPSTGCPAGHTLDSFMYYDALHPTPKTESYVAAEFIKVAAKTSKYGIYF